jgi:hypothetical protein
MKKSSALFFFIKQILRRLLQNMNGLGGIGCAWLARDLVGDSVHLKQTLLGEHNGLVPSLVVPVVLPVQERVDVLAGTCDVDVAIVHCVHIHLPLQLLKCRREGLHRNPFTCCLLEDGSEKRLTPCPTEERERVECHLACWMLSIRSDSRAGLRHQPLVNFLCIL